MAQKALSRSFQCEQVTPGSLTGSSVVVTRRRFVASGASTLPMLTRIGSAHAKVPAGFKTAVDTQDGYQFAYPNGWQATSFAGYDAAFTDVIEALEGVTLAVASTSRSSVTELGSPEDACRKLLDTQIESSNQSAKLLKASERIDSNTKQPIYDFEFAVAAPSYLRHCLGCLAIANGRQYTLAAGSDERRFRKAFNQLKTVRDSFTLTPA